MTVEQQIDELLSKHLNEIKAGHDSKIKAKLLQIVSSNKWWITNGYFKDGGKKVLGPFESKDLALAVRNYVEYVNGSRTYFVDQLKGGK